MLRRAPRRKPPLGQDRSRADAQRLPALSTISSTSSSTALLKRSGHSLRVLVTGGAGFFGSHVVDALLARGDAVLVVDDLSTGDLANLDKRAVLKIGDVSDPAALAKALRGERVDSVVHCAAKTKVVESMEKEALYRRVIVDGTRNVLDVSKTLGASVFVNISTGGAIYGETPECAAETAPTAPESNYGRFKAEAERLVDLSGLTSITLRLANIYGPRQRKDLEGGVIAIFIGCWKRGEPITVYGDGSYQRDYVYVSDVVEGVLVALGGKHRGVYNIGTGVATSVNDLVSALTLVLGPPADIRSAPARRVEVLRGCVDPSKAARDRLWRPQISLADGLRLTAVAEGALAAPA
ncbi:MAG: NAD-dependent epimerase/dehydratase family protein [Chloroflexi bacterium]|nr:MAG: NAD-dependent epimerase/dehydratase family protein [Chloroflexota bacterium]